MKIFCESCKSVLENELDILKETTCNICGEKGVFVPESECLMCYEI